MGKETRRRGGLNEYKMFVKRVCGRWRRWGRAGCDKVAREAVEEAARGMRAADQNPAEGAGHRLTGAAGGGPGIALVRYSHPLRFPTPNWEGSG